MSVQLFVGQSITLGVRPRDGNGNIGYVDGAPTWEPSETGVVSLAPSTDGLTCAVTALAPGTMELTPRALADANPIQGNPVDFVTAPPPLLPAVTLEVFMGPITQITFGKQG